LMLRCSFAPAWGMSRPGCTGLPFSALSAIVIVLWCWSGVVVDFEVCGLRGSEVCSGFWELEDVLSAFLKGTHKTRTGAVGDGCGRWKEREEAGRRTGGTESR
jgi:hypothetical protein